MKDLFSKEAMSLCDQRSSVCLCPTILRRLAVLFTLRIGRGVLDGAKRKAENCLLVV